MFNNRFNSTHKDPLVEAVRQAQQDGEIRRQAEAIVNEAFGVYSRNAVVREDLEGYDISVEEVYQELKEATMSHITTKSGKGGESVSYRGRKLGKISSYDHEDSEGKKTGRTKWAATHKSGDDTVGSKSREHAIADLRGMEASSIRAKRAMRKEELADKDYDKDGKIESPKDEVWGSRFRAAKKAGKMEEGLDVVKRDPSVQGSGDVTKSAPKEDPSLPKSYPGAASSAPTAARLSNAKAAVTPIKEEGVTAPKEFGQKRFANKGAVTKAPVPGVSIAEDNLDEVSKGRAISAYRQKEGEERDTSKLHGLIKRKWGKETAKHAERAGAQDTVGLVRRGEDRGKEDSLARDRRFPRDRMTKSGKVHKQDTATLKGNIKRRLGSHTKPGHLPEEHIDEAAYSAKAARAGKDIGKPGKMFSKIAAKAGERYGSEERGKKVAGAILKRIRAKHMKENNDQ